MVLFPRIIFIRITKPGGCVATLRKIFHFMVESHSVQFHLNTFIQHDKMHFFVIIQRENRVILLLFVHKINFSVLNFNFLSILFLLIRFYLARARPPQLRKSFDFWIIIKKKKDEAIIIKQIHLFIL